MPAENPQAVQVSQVATAQPPPDTTGPLVSVNTAGPAHAASAAAAEDAHPAAVHPAQPEAIPPLPAAPTKHATILSFLENARVAGVRVAGDDSRVLMNDHVYRVNDVVNAEVGLRLSGVGASALTFVDENGKVYTKNY
jgi:hypothetical protein